jgi:purine-binding chemotaxis protein CheW
MSVEAGFVLFVLNKQRYALPLADVEVIISLPALTIVPDAPRHLAGVFDLHGRIVPVVDLSISLGGAARRYSLTDSVIVLRGDSSPFGVVVNNVIDVCAVFQTPINMGDGSSTVSSQFVAGVVRVDEEMVLVLDHRQLVRLAASAESLIDRNITESRRGSTDDSLPESGERPFFLNISPEEQSAFRRRALSLMAENRVHDRAGNLPMVVAGLNGEYFGVSLDRVKEFAESRNITPVPCCPQHILGNMNLRGEVLTVIDMRPALKMQVSKEPQKRVIVLEHNGLTVGVSVDEIYEVVHVDPARITSRLTVSSGVSGYVNGTAPYGNHVMTILDLPKLLDGEDLVVNEEV